MKEQNGRRSFLKYLFSLSAIAAGSGLSLSLNKGFKMGKLTPTEALGSTGKRIKKISVEEHFQTEEYVALSGSRTSGFISKTQNAKVDKALNLGEGRIKDMDDGGIDMQLLSLSPGVNFIESVDNATAICRSTNNELAKAVKLHPERFAGLASIPLQDPNAAVDELERAIKELGLRGVIIMADRSGKYLADPKYRLVLERLEKLDVPAYFHSSGVDSGLVTEFSWLMNNGIFDDFPGLKIIVGHGGESIPFWLWRLDGRWKEAKLANELGEKSPITYTKKRPSEYFKSHFYVTTSAQCWQPLLQFLISAIGAERVLFAVDYPYESISEAVQFAESVQINDSDREKICHLNAESLFRI